MERALKERIIGASVLVVFVVLVVPVFLDGPPEEGAVVTQQVTLPGQAEQSTQTIVLDRDRDEPVPVASTRSHEPEVDSRAPEVQAGAAPPPASESDATAATRQAVSPPTPEPEERAPAEKPRTIASVASAGTSSTGMWAVQLGSFSSQENAEKLAASLRKQGFAAFLSKLSTDSGELHRVRVGPQKDRDDAQAMAARLGNAGHKGQVVPHP